jgi:hypothetical protein
MGATVAISGRERLFTCTSSKNVSGMQPFPALPIPLYVALLGRPGARAVTIPTQGGCELGREPELFVAFTRFQTTVVPPGIKAPGMATALNAAPEHTVIAASGIITAAATCNVNVKVGPVQNPLSGVNSKTMVAGAPVVLMGTMASGPAPLGAKPVMPSGNVAVQVKVVPGGRTSFAAFAAGV